MFALLPVRLFFGTTFLWAGLDKLLDPAFLDPAAPTSLHAQLVAFARFSPLGPLITATLPFSSMIGLLISVAEIGVGIGALTGVAFRVAVVGGMTLSLMFWLTASWATHPYYFGADLPYAFGWLALAIAGHGEVLVPSRFTSGWRPPAQLAPDRVAGLDTAPSPERRLLLQTATLAGLAAVVASLTLPFRTLGLLADRTGGGPLPGPTPTPLSTQGSTVPPGAISVARVADVAKAGSVAFTVPFDAPAPLPAGDPGVIVQLADGTFVAFDAICTHAACTVEWDATDRLLVCPCHEAIFDAEHGAAVLGGPAPAPLAQLPLVIDAATGTILLVPSA